tara:strand:- start:1223 stop:1534 length:312 start_codon:yes stop_codon:yes gene_type:complete
LVFGWITDLEITSVSVVVAFSTFFVISWYSYLCVNDETKKAHFGPLVNTFPFATVDRGTTGAQIVAAANRQKEDKRKVSMPPFCHAFCHASIVARQTPNDQGL